MANKKMGRPKKEIDRNQFESLCSIQCTEKEICSVFGVTDKTLVNWIREEYGDEYGPDIDFKDIFHIKSALGKISLRRWQFDQAKKNVTMAIWLGKNWLDQTDNVKVEAGNDTLAAAKELLSGISSVIE